MSISAVLNPVSPAPNCNFKDCLFSSICTIISVSASILLVITPAERDFIVPDFGAYELFVLFIVPHSGAPNPL